MSRRILYAFGGSCNLVEWRALLRAARKAVAARRAVDVAERLAAAEEKLTTKILAYLASAEKHGEAGESVSYLHRELTRDFRGLGCLADFESLVERLGFRVVSGKNSRGQARREVRL